MKIYIHIGLHKTGSTSFQRSCEENADLLRDHGLYYPLSLPNQSFYSQHHDIAILVENKDWDGVREVLNWIVDEAQISSAETVLLSSESFSGLVGKKGSGFKYFEQLLLERFSDLRYYCVFRKAEELLASNFKQQLAHSGVGLLSSKQTIREMLAYSLRNADNLVNALGPRLVKLSFSDLTRDERGYCTALLRSMVPESEVEISDIHTNTSEDFYADPAQFLTTIVRAGIALQMGKNPYANQVDKKISQLVNMDTLREAFYSKEDISFASSSIQESAALRCAEVCDQHLDSLREKYSSIADTDLFLAPDEPHAKRVTE